VGGEVRGAPYSQRYQTVAVAVINVSVLVT
jgi:hypothetical protein